MALLALTSSASCSPLPIHCPPFTYLEKLLPKGDFNPLNNRKRTEVGEIKQEKETGKLIAYGFFFSVLPRMRQMIKRQTSRQIPSSRETFGWWCCESGKNPGGRNGTRRSGAGSRAVTAAAALPRSPHQCAWQLRTTHSQPLVLPLSPSGGESCSLGYLGAWWSEASLPCCVNGIPRDLDVTEPEGPSSAVTGRVNKLPPGIRRVSPVDMATDLCRASAQAWVNISGTKHVCKEQLPLCDRDTAEPCADAQLSQKAAELLKSFVDPRGYSAKLRREAGKKVRKTRTPETCTPPFLCSSSFEAYL